MNQPSTEQVQKNVTEVALKPGFSLSVEAIAYGSSKSELKDHRYEDQGQLVIRLNTFEPNFERNLRRQLGFSAAN